MERVEPDVTQAAPRSFPWAVALVPMLLLWGGYHDAVGDSAYRFGLATGTFLGPILFAYLAFLVFRRSRMAAWVTVVVVVVAALSGRGRDLRQIEQARLACSSQMETDLAAVGRQLQAVSDAGVLSLPTSLAKADLARCLELVDIARIRVGEARACLEGGKGYEQHLLASGVSSGRIPRELEAFKSNPENAAAVAILVEYSRWLDAASDLLRGLEANYGHWRIPANGELVIADDVQATTKQGILAARERLLQAEKRAKAADEAAVRPR